MDSLVSDGRGEMLDPLCDRLDAEADLMVRMADALKSVSAEIRGTQSDAPDLLGVKEAAARFGLSEWAVRKLLSENKLPSVRIGNRHLIPKDAIRGLLHEPPNGMP